MPVDRPDEEKTSIHKGWRFYDRCAERSKENYAPGTLFFVWENITFVRNNVRQILDTYDL
jgi:hypothetical protein